MKPVMTEAGFNAMVKALAGTPLVFTKIAMGSGASPISKAKTDPTKATSLRKWEVSVPVDSVTVDEHEDYAQINAIFTNEFMEKEFEWTEVGIYCSIGQSNDIDISSPPNEDILYAYGHCKYEKDDGVSIKIPSAGNEVFELRFRYHVYASGAAEVTQSVRDELYAESTQKYGKVLEKHLTDYKNPHRTTLEQLGLKIEDGVGDKVSHSVSNHSLNIDTKLEDMSASEMLDIITAMQRKLIALSAGTDVVDETKLEWLKD